VRSFLRTFRLFRADSLPEAVYVNKTVRWPYFQTMCVSVVAHFFLFFQSKTLTSSRSVRRAHQPMHINDWIEIDSAYKEQVRRSLLLTAPQLILLFSQVAYKRKVVAEKPEKTALSLPENDEGAGELLDVLVDYLPKVRRRLCFSSLLLLTFPLLRQRFPTLFDALPGGGIINKILNERHENCAALKGVEALKVIAWCVFFPFFLPFLAEQPLPRSQPCPD
jgi:hypothetical protein